MRLKEIKPGIVIHCKTQEEANVLCDNFGASQEWKDYWCSYESDTCYEISMNNKIICFGKVGSFSGRCIFEFSELILPELTAEEAIKLIGELCKGSCQKCPLHGVEPYEICENLCYENPEKAVEILAYWKSEHEKKEPEIETVDICRIIEIKPDGNKLCVHEEDISDGELMYSGDAVENCRYTLKNYCKEHDGEFIAVHEVVSRVKR